MKLDTTTPMQGSLIFEVMWRDIFQLMMWDAGYGNIDTVIVKFNTRNANHPRPMEWHQPFWAIRAGRFSTWCCFPGHWRRKHIDGFTQDCSILSALAMEIPRSCTKPSIWAWHHALATRQTPVMVKLFSLFSDPWILNPRDAFSDTHYSDVIMRTIASLITSLAVVYSTVYSYADQRNIKAPRHWPLCGEFTGTGEFPAQRASYAENVSIWWRHHVIAIEHV